MALYLLFESAFGYALFHAYGVDEIAQDTQAIRDSIVYFDRFCQVVKLTAFSPSTSAIDAINQCIAISEGIMTYELRIFLEMNLPKVKKGRKAKFSVGVSEPKVGSQISEVINIPCQSNDFVLELLRGVRLHFVKFIKDLKPTDLEKAQLGLGHSYSRAKVKFNVNQEDNMVIEAIFLLDTLDKDINSFSMRVREWYGNYFPELVKIVNDNYLYAKIVTFVENKSVLSETHIQALADIVGDEDKAKYIVEAAKTSMGQDISPIELISVQQIAQRVINLSEYRKKSYDYLVTTMNHVALNLASLIGEVVGARLISHAGSLSNLAKCPASTVQILGAEKALFRALRAHGKTPKYGLIFHSSFIGRASGRNKGRMARYLANKCAIASRIDYFSETNTTVFGEKLREQLEERLDFYEKGVTPRKNLNVMKTALESMSQEDGNKEETPAKKSKKKKSNGEADDDEVMDVDISAYLGTEKKKNHKLEQPDEDMIEAANGGDQDEDGDVKMGTESNKKKKKS